MGIRVPIVFILVSLAIRLICVDSQNVTIVRWGNVYANSIAALPFTGPAFDTGFYTVRKHYASAEWRFRQVSVVDPAVSDCDELSFNIDNMLSRWYFSNVDSIDLLAFIGPGELFVCCGILK